MSEEEKEWNINKLDESMNEIKHEFVELQIQLHYLAVKICLWALKTFQHGQSEPLNPLQIRQVVEHELDMILEDVSKPRFMDATLERAMLEWKKLEKNKGS